VKTIDKRLKEFDRVAEKWSKSHDKCIYLITVVLPKIITAAFRLNQTRAIVGLDRLQKIALINQCRIEIEWAAYEYECL